MTICDFCKTEAADKKAGMVIGSTDLTIKHYETYDACDICVARIAESMNRLLGRGFDKLGALFTASRKPR